MLIRKKINHTTHIVVLFRHRNYLNDVCFEMVSITILIVLVIPSIRQGKACLYKFMFLLILRLFQTVMA